MCVGGGGKGSSQSMGLALSLADHWNFEEVAGRPRSLGKELPCGDHILRAKKMGMEMKPCLESLEEAKGRQSLEHKVDEVTGEAAIDGEKNFQDKCGQQGR